MLAVAEILLHVQSYRQFGVVTYIKSTHFFQTTTSDLPGTAVRSPNPASPSIRTREPADEGNIIITTNSAKKRRVRDATEVRPPAIL
ncbi:hypothetical protein C7212DRAFT_320180 [Tuber magnatum]|uniref:Uncharacterized protein n=1 Tax=Tuber magnatum TaxID=42249 RepID=A0A317SQW3_9PEZI|nr:hypothetical protein C7212DRAFT_320180 [Tuber magnatum]